jgi:hypothetical protein
MLFLTKNEIFSQLFDDIISESDDRCRDSLWNVGNF